MNIINLPFVEGFALQSYMKAEDGISYASNNQYEYWYIDGSLEHDTPEMWDAHRIDNMLKLIDTHKTKPLYHGNFKAPLASDLTNIRMAAIEYVKTEIDLASKLQAPVIIHGGMIVEPRQVVMAKKKAISCYLDSVLRIIDYASMKNVEIYLENLSNYKNSHPFYYIFTHDEELEFILSATNANFFLDIGHANIGNDAPVNIFSKFHKYIIGMSFSNNNGINDQHLSLNKGIINYKSILDAIQNTNWRGIVAFEIRDKSPRTNILELQAMYETDDDNN